MNDWEFGHDNLISVYERLTDAGVDIIEVGFIDERRPFDINRSIFPDTKSVRRIWAGAKKRPPMVVGMIDYGTCDIGNLEPADESFIEGIRVIFKKHLMHEAMDYCAQVKTLGYKVFAQLVSVTTYTDEELMELISLVNAVEPYAVSMVDTYGLLNPRDMLHIYEILDENVSPNVGIGFHAHNNLQLAYANCIAFLEKEQHHDLVVDGTMYGMGKSAGNAPLELLMMELNQKYNGHYDVHPILESIEESIMDFYKKSPWGYKIFFYLSAENRCHPTYVSDYQKKQNLSVSDLDSLLKTIEPKDKKLLYDKKVSERVYDDYHKKYLDDGNALDELRHDLDGRDVLLIGPGKNIQLQEKMVRDYIDDNHPIIICANFIPKSFEVDYVFVTNAKRYQQMTDSLHEITNQNIKIIATSNVTCVKGNNFSYRIDRSPLLEQHERITDNSFLMLLRVLKRIGITNISCAGFDGYSDKEVNYFNPSMEYSFIRDEAQHLNHHMKESIENEFSDMIINFVTFSHYTEKEDSHEAAF